MRKMLTTAAMLLASLAVPATPAVAAPPPPNKMVLDIVGVNGSGCPQSTVGVQVSPDNTAITITYSNYLAQVGVGASPLDFRKNCQIAMNVHVPQGFTYAIAKADYRGFVHLESGASGYEAANYYFQGESQNARVQHNFFGPRDGDWTTTDVAGVASLSFLPCGEMRNLNVNTELRVNAGTSDTRTKTSMLTMDSTDTSLTTVYHLAWKKC